MTFVLPLTSRSHLYLPHVQRHFFLTALLTIDSWFDNLLLREGSFNNAVGQIFWRSIIELRILYSNLLPHCVQEINIYCFWWPLSGDFINIFLTIICTWVWIVCHRYPDPCIFVTIFAIMFYRSDNISGPTQQYRYSYWVKKVSWFDRYWNQFSLTTATHESAILKTCDIIIYYY